MVKKQVKDVSIALKPINIEKAFVDIVGDSPYISHAFGEDARKVMRGTPGVDKIRKKKEPRDPVALANDALYWISKRPAKPTAKDIEKGTFGVRAITIKCAIIDSTTQVDGITKVFLRGAIRIGEGKNIRLSSGYSHELLKIEAPPPLIVEDVVRLSGPSRAADLRYRPYFFPWRVKVPIQYNANVITLDTIVNMLNLAGWANGIGDWRAQKNGDNGAFHVEAA